MNLSRRNFFASLALARFSSNFPALAADPPKRGMIVRSTRPEDLEMPLDGFASWITPVDRFFVRSHHYTPSVDLARWKLALTGEVTQPVTLTMDDLRRMPKAEVVSVLECAGNGRSFYEPPLIGLQWEHGAVGNGRWAGVRLADVLKRAGLKDTAREIVFDGADVPVGTMPDFQRAIPVKKAMDPSTLLAFEMNGQTLPVSHGFPLRLIVPGWGGDCWTKWVTTINVLAQEFDGFFMKTAYRHPGRAVVPGAAIDPAAMHPVTELRVKSVIASPAEGAVVRSERLRISGAAWSGMFPIASVEVSTDRGRSWRQATLGPEVSQYGWRLWEFNWVPSQTGHHVLMARARDAGGNMQPFVEEWNPSGYLWNVVHHVGVDVVTELPAAAPPQASAPAPVPSPASYRGACVTCHEEDVIAQQRLTRGQWEREVDKMVRWGAPVKPDQRDEILEFLVRRFGPRPRR